MRASNSTALLQRLLGKLNTSATLSIKGRLPSVGRSLQTRQVGVAAAFAPSSAHHPRAVMCWADCTDPLPDPTLTHDPLLLLCMEQFGVTFRRCHINEFVINDGAQCNSWVF